MAIYTTTVVVCLPSDFAEVGVLNEFIALKYLNFCFGVIYENSQESYVENFPGGFCLARAKKSQEIIK